MEWETYKWQGKRLGGVGEVMTGGVYKCGYCRGTGFTPRTNAKCPICRGEGENRIEGSVVRCAFCRGSGVGHSGSTVTCTCCKGKGVIPVKEPVELCPKCRGTGRTGSQLSCMNCRGKGVIEVKEKKVPSF